MSIAIDYKSFTADGPVQKQNPDHQWWRLPRERIPAAIASVVETLQKAQTQVETQRTISARLYGNAPIFGVTGLSYAKLPTNPTIRDRVTFNLVQSVIDTIQAKIAKNRPKPLFLTKRGDYRLQRKAQKLNQFMDGVFFENEVASLSPMVFRDGCIIGSGATHVFDWYGRVRYERVMASELLVDEQEALYGEPRQLHRMKAVDRRVLADMFPSKRKAIMEANAISDPQLNATPHVADQIVVAESWHLPSGPKAKDGMHTICIVDHILNDDTSWELDFFPFAFFHWSKRIYGFWGQALAEQLQNIQLELNKLLWVVQRSLHLGGTFKVLIENGSKIVKEHINNDIGAIVNYTGTPPTYVTPPGVQPEIYQHIMTLIQRGYEQAGISMLSATAQKPAGLDSGKALREYNDIESERFMMVGKAYEKFHLDLAKLTISTAKQIYAKDKKFEVAVPGKKFIDTIDWKDVDLEEDQYLMQCFPISSLPNDPEGRLQTIQEYIQAGFIDPRQGRRLLDFPDIDQVESLANAAEERILRVLDKIVDEGEFTPPDQYMPPDVARELALQYYNQFVNEGLEVERLDLITTFINQLDDLEAKAAQAAMPPPGALPPGPLPPELAAGAAAPMPGPALPPGPVPPLQ